MNHTETPPHTSIPSILNHCFSATLQPLVFGFGFMFKLDESSIAGHLGERAPRLGLEDEEEEEGEGGKEWEGARHRFEGD